MSGKWDYRNTMVTCTVANKYVQAFAGNRRRVTVIIGQTDSSSVHVADRDNGTNGDSFFATNVGTEHILSYRDFGSLIQGDIWIRSSVVPLTFPVTEIFSVAVL